MGHTTCLNVQAGKVRDLAGEATLLVNWARDGTVTGNDTMLDTDAVIVFTKSRSAVNNTSTGIISNISIAHNLETATFELLIKVLEGRSIFPALHVFSLETLEDLEPSFLGILVQNLKTLLHKDINVTSQLILDLDVFKIRMNS